MSKPLPTYELRVPVPVPCCPFCGGERLTVTHSEHRSGDGDNGGRVCTRWLKCRTCGKAFKLVLQYEPAHFRSPEVVPGDRGRVRA